MCQRDLERIDRRIDADVLCAFCRNELERYSVHDRGKILVRFDAEDKISSVRFLQGSLPGISSTGSRTRGRVLWPNGLQL